MDGAFVCVWKKTRYLIECMYYVWFRVSAQSKKKLLYEFMQMNEDEKKLFTHLECLVRYRFEFIAS